MYNLTIKRELGDVVGVLAYNEATHPMPVKPEQHTNAAIVFWFIQDEPVAPGYPKQLKFYVQVMMFNRTLERPTLEIAFPGEKELYNMPDISWFEKSMPETYLGCLKDCLRFHGKDLNTTVGSDTAHDSVSFSSIDRMLGNNHKPSITIFCDLKPGDKEYLDSLNPYCHWANHAEKDVWKLGRFVEIPTENDNMDKDWYLFHCLDASEEQVYAIGKENGFSKDGLWILLRGGKHALKYGMPLLDLVKWAISFEDSDFMSSVLMRSLLTIGKDAKGIVKSIMSCPDITNSFADKELVDFVCKALQSPMTYHQILNILTALLAKGVSAKVICDALIRANTHHVDKGADEIFFEPFYEKALNMLCNPKLIPPHHARESIIELARFARTTGTLAEFKLGIDNSVGNIQLNLFAKGVYAGIMIAS